ncbi:MAG: ABC transporter substrate-binding protein [Gemmatimonadota bacterium]|jgi:ABC-type branched-subunit amino acid transport system substrate-binding protein
MAFHPLPPDRIPVRSSLAALAAVVLPWLWACGAFGGGPEPPPPEEAPPPPLVLADELETDSARLATAADLLDEARAALAEGEVRQAAQLGWRVAREYPGTPSSGPALLVWARGEMALGRYDEAHQIRDRYARLLPPEDPRRAELALLDAEERIERGEVEAGLTAILSLPQDLPDETRAWALHRVRSAVEVLGAEALERVVQATPLGQPLAAPLMLAHARALWVRGEEERAIDFAETALAVGAEGEDAEAARAFLEAPGDLGRVGGRGGPATVGVLLPLGGSPALSRYAGLVEEGIQVAMEGEDVPDGIALALRDDGGRSDEAARALEELSRDGARALIGPLQSESVVAVANARREPVPIISPTAPTVGDLEAVYTLGGPDPGAADALATYATESGLDHVVVIHPRTPEYEFEASVFRDRMEELGGSVLRVLSYPVGTTTFGEVLDQARHLDPDALVLPVPASDIVALAPQVSFFGLDTLGIRVLGTGEWSSDGVLREVAPRHTNGVVVATPRPPGGELQGHRRFQQAYERHFRRSLRSTVPALGWDAASLILAALETGARTAAELRAALESIDRLQGATGVLSVQDGRIVREHHLGCISERQLQPVRVMEPSGYFRPERRGDPEAGEPERVPLGPLQIFCPGVPLPDTTGMRGFIPTPGEESQHPWP